MTPNRSATIFALVAIALAILAFTRSNIFNMPIASDFSLTSSAFKSGETIPSKYTCDGQNISPPLAWSSLPEGAKSLALIMDDPDVPKQVKPEGVFDHWTLFNISPSEKNIAEGSTTGIPGANGRGQNAYTGPCPPPQYEPKEHRYYFRLYALSAPLTLQAGATKQHVLDAIKPVQIGEAELVGRYSRQ